MAGKVRFAAKWILATSVLAGGGAGAWYFTTNGWPMVAGLVRSDAAELVPEDGSPAQGKSFAGGDLDAVAGAWAEPTPSRTDAPSVSSPRARSADIAPTSARDRYDFVAEPVAAPAATPVDAAPDTSEPNTAPEATPDTAAAIEPAPQADAPNSVAEDDADTAALARGQEPKEETKSDDLFAGASDAQEPQPLKNLADDRGMESAKAQGENPFRAGPSSATDRYGAATARSEQDKTVGNAAIVNPFATKPSADAAAGSASGQIEPLPALPGEVEGQLQALDQGNPTQPVGGADRTPRATAGDEPRSFGASSQPRTVESGLNSEPGPSPQSSQEGSAGDGIGRPGERALEGPQRPALEIQKLAPAEIQVGKPAKFVVQVRNVGTQPADGVIIRDAVPHGTRLISTTPNAENEGGQLVWQLGKLSPGEDRTVEMQLMPTGEGEVGSVATVSYSAQASVKTRCTMPQLAIRMTAPSKVLVGQEQRVKIELRNPGSGNATGVMLFENVPQNVRHPAGPALEFDIGTLRAGETRQLELVLFAEKAGQTVNVLSARAEGNLQVQQQVEFEVIAPGLSVDVNGPERRYLERPATYEVTVENPGTAPAHDVQIVTKLPKGLRFVRANNMGEYDAAGHAVHWSLAELPEGERGTVELVAMPVETGPQTLQVEGRAGQGLSDQAERQIVIDGLAAIMFEVRDLEDPIEVGGETGYEIRVVNQGTKAASNVQVAISLPPGMKLVSAEGETAHTSERGTVIFEPIPQLAAKADTVYRVRVQGTEAGDQRVTVEVNTDDLGQPIRREESTRIFGDE